MVRQGLVTSAARWQAARMSPNSSSTFSMPRMSLSTCAGGMRWAVPKLHAVPAGALWRALLTPGPGYTCMGAMPVVQKGMHVCSSTGEQQSADLPPVTTPIALHLLACLLMAALDEAVGRVWQQDAAQREHDGGEPCAGQGDAPAVAGDVLRADVDGLRHHNAQRQHDLRTRGCKVPLRRWKAQLPVSVRRRPYTTPCLSALHA